MMKYIKVNDNSKYQKEIFSELPELTQKIRDKTLIQLEKEGVFVFPECLKDSEDITEKQMLLQSINEEYRTQNIMGFIGLGDERLVISSRFSDRQNDYFLWYMLERVLDIPNIVELDTDADFENRLFHILIFLFPHYLKQAMRKGVFKNYIRRKYNDGNIKGIIDIKQHIDKNTPFIGNVAYSQREYSYDNYLMELIRHTIEFIKKKPYGRNILSLVKSEVQLVVDATQNYEFYDRKNVIVANARNTIRHAYYREYRTLQHLCILILQKQKHQIGSGSRQIYGILFDGAWLWEEYIGLLVNDIFYHPMNKVKKGKQILFNRKVGEIYPDFISRNHDNRIIADAKYKPIGNIKNKDYLQLLAYMFRFDSKKGYYFYPETVAVEKEYLWLNQGSTYEENVIPRNDVYIIKHGLKIPSSTDGYEDFSSKMKISEKEFKNIFYNS